MGAAQKAPELETLWKEVVGEINMLPGEMTSLLTELNALLLLVEHTALKRKGLLQLQ